MWIIENRDGSIEQVGSRKGHKGYKRSAKLPRVIDFGAERWDWKRRTIVPVAALALARIDQAHDADHGPHRRAIDYAIKRLEAVILLDAIQSEGLLAQEAKLRGVSVVELARQVLAKPTHNPELTRIAEKIAA